MRINKRMLRYLYRFTIISFIIGILLFFLSLIESLFYLKKNYQTNQESFSLGIYDDRSNG